MDSSTHNQSTSSNNHQPPEPPRNLCVGGCGFFGTAENRGLCSKCYAGYIKQVMSKSEAAIISDEQKTSTKIESEVDINELIKALNSAAINEIDTNDSSSVSDPPVVVKTRCGCCNKKVGLLGFKCRCGETFCKLHRYPEAHPCNFDFKTAGKIAIEKENPVCKADKISDRI